ncbi:hypothetical protein BASA81_010532 [Batrachochytrium salamandrivorans]|nr:hypothetical protein BASA81_010532 [Batrachochytrium salamandrivorans]
MLDVDNSRGSSENGGEPGPIKAFASVARAAHFHQEACVINPLKQAGNRCAPERGGNGRLAARRVTVCGYSVLVAPGHKSCWMERR